MQNIDYDDIDDISFGAKAFKDQAFDNSKLQTPSKPARQNVTPMRFVEVTSDGLKDMFIDKPPNKFKPLTTPKRNEEIE